MFPRLRERIVRGIADLEALLVNVPFTSFLRLGFTLRGFEALGAGGG